MSLNYREIDLIIEELKNLFEIENSFLQNITQPDYSHIIFEIYGKSGNISLLISLNRDSPTLCSTRFKRKKSVKIPRFAQFLRSKIKGSKIISIKQIGGERIVQMDLAKGGDRFFLLIKLWGGAANIILTDSSYKVLDAFTRRPDDEETPGKIFDPQKFIRDNPPKREIREYPSDTTFNMFLDNQLQETENRNEINILREKTLKRLKREIGRNERSLDNLKNERDQYLEHKSYTQYGDYIQSNLYLLKGGEEFLITDDYRTEGLKIKITLDPNLSPTENANSYYKKAGKAKRGLEILEKEIIRREKKLKNLQIDEKKVLDTDSSETLKSILANIETEGEDLTGDSRNQFKPAEKTPGLSFFSHGYSILIGRTSDENDSLLRKFVRGSDYWLHTRDYPGGYVFIRVPKGKPVPQEVLLDAANLAVFFSKAKKNSEADLYYTQVKYLRRAKGAKKGTVLPTQEKNIFVKTEKARLSRLLDKPLSAF